HLEPRPGPIADERGRVIGEHAGLMYYTLGQRRGLRIGGRKGASEAPWYVIGKDPAANRLEVSQDASHAQLFSRRLRTAAFHWIRRPPSLDGAFTARIRHRQALQDCEVSEEGGRLEFRFAQPQRAAVAGQYAVL